MRGFSSDAFRPAIDQGRLLELLELPSEEVERRTADIQVRIDAASLRGANETLSLSAEARRLYQTTLERERNAFDVAQDLDDENFTVRVTLPGAVIADNGDELEGSTVVWTFSGKDLHDHDLVLVAHSVLEGQR